MSRAIPSVLLALSVVLFSSSASSQDLTDLTGVQDAIDSIKSSATQIINSAEASATVAGFSISSNLQILMQNLDLIAAKHRKDTLRDLSDAERKIVADAHRLVRQTDLATSGAIDRLNLLVDSTGTEISRLPWVLKQPLVTRVSPTHVLEGQPTYEVEFRGSRLAQEGVGLVLNNSACSLLNSTDTSLRFLCQSEAFQAEVPWSRGQLTLSTKKKWWDFFGSDVNTQYSVGLKTIGRKLGTYVFSADIETSTLETIQRKQHQEVSNGHCEGPTPRAWTFRPTSSCRVDPQSVRAKSDTTKKSSCESPADISEFGFSVRCTARNSGDCTRIKLPFGKVKLTKDARGSAKVDAYWNDLCPKTSTLQVPEVSGEIYWGEDVAISLPEGQKVLRWKLTITQSNGVIRILDRAADEKWFTLTEGSSASIIVHPKELPDALRN